KWDAFISYAHEDSKIATLLAQALESRHLRIWYDKTVLKVGDRLLDAIDQGLLHSRYGIVILSGHFFEKHWPRLELDGLIQKEIDGTKVVLPVWHNISSRDVRKLSPILAGREAARTTDGIDKVAEQIRDAIEQEAHPLRKDIVGKLEKQTDDEKVKYFVQVLIEISDPRSYISLNQETGRVSGRLRELKWKWHTVDEFYELYIDTLGISGANGPALMKHWMTELQEDPWWETMMVSHHKPGLPPTPENIATWALELEDFDDLVRICSRAYKAGVVAENRRIFIDMLRGQNEAVVEGVCKGWVYEICRPAKGDYQKVRADMTSAFRALQRIQIIRLPYSSLKTKP
ncbi:MAG: TIR domain-containing protein, partial [Anaerolineales bacterium]